MASFATDRNQWLYLCKDIVVLPGLKILYIGNTGSGLPPFFFFLEQNYTSETGGWTI